VVIAEHQQGGAVGRGQRVQAAEGGQRVGGPGDGAGAFALAGDGQAAVDVPGGQGPALAAAEGGDLGDGVVGLVGADPQAGEAGADVLGEALGERHEGLPFRVMELGMVEGAEDDQLDWRRSWRAGCSW
jgi:hypothetical protein